MDLMRREVVFNVVLSLCILILVQGLVQGGEALTEDEAYAQRWSREDLMEELRLKEVWMAAEAGKSEEVMSPWTPMEVKGQDVLCWGRIYRYDNTLFPAQVVSQGDEHFTDAPYILLRSGGRTYKLQRGNVDIKRKNDGLVRVNTETSSGPFTVKIETEYEFDGMGKVTLTLEAERGERVDGMELVFPLKSQKAGLFHYIIARKPGLPGMAGHPPLTDAGFVPEGGFRLDLFREMVWLGDQWTGFTWFAEGMENWQIRDEEGIQSLEPVQDGMNLRIKLVDRSFTLSDELELVFGIQATPMRPRGDKFRINNSWYTLSWNWHWGDGASYYPFHSHPARIKKAREQIETQRASGKEVMPCSSLQFFRRHRVYESRFGKIENPGLPHRELVLWEPLWTRCRSEGDVPPELILEEEAIESFMGRERHTSESDWYGKRYQPRGLLQACPNSPFQDYYLWKLEQLVKDTGLGAWYLDQPVPSCFNHHHGCGYVDYKSEWAPSVPIFAMREMTKRIRRIFYEAHGDARIKWHMSNQLLVPVISFIDTNWDGENYGQSHGTLWVEEFYSDLLPDGRMQAQHTGLQFGFVPELLPQFTQLDRDRRRAPTAASTRDMIGWFFVHDSNVSPLHTDPHRELVGYLSDKRFSYEIDDKEVIYYWEEGRGVDIGPERVKFIMHYDDEEALLILFNRSDELALAEVKLDLKALGVSGKAGTVTDALTGEKLTADAGRFNADVLPRDLRMLEINW